MQQKSVSGKHSVLKRKDAREAVRNAKKAYDHKKTAKPKAWRKGGQEWSKVLGHFGIAK